MKVFVLASFAFGLVKGMAHTDYQFNHNIVHQTTSVQTLAHQAQQLPSLPSYTDVPLSKTNPDIDNYIRYQMPQLTNAELVKTQILQDRGTNYANTYKNNNQLYTILVWDNPTDRVRQIKGLNKIETNGSSRSTTKIRISNASLAETANSLFA